MLRYHGDILSTTSYHGAADGEVQCVEWEAGMISTTATGDVNAVSRQVRSGYMMSLSLQMEFPSESRTPVLQPGI